LSNRKIEAKNIEKNLQSTCKKDACFVDNNLVSSRLSFVNIKYFSSICRITCRVLSNNRNKISNNCRAICRATTRSKKEKEINKFKKISNIKKLKEYKRLLILILKKESKLRNFKLRNRQ